MTHLHGEEIYWISSLWRWVKTSPPQQLLFWPSSCTFLLVATSLWRWPPPQRGDPLDPLAAPPYRNPAELSSKPRCLLQWRLWRGDTARGSTRSPCRASLPKSDPTHSRRALSINGHGRKSEGRRECGLLQHDGRKGSGH